MIRHDRPSSEQLIIQTSHKLVTISMHPLPLQTSTFHTILRNQNPDRQLHLESRQTPTRRGNTKRHISSHKLLVHHFSILLNSFWNKFPGFHIRDAWKSTIYFANLSKKKPHQIDTILGRGGDHWGAL